MFCCVYIPDFPVAAVLRCEPELREHAVAVVEGTPPLLRVVCVNQHASRLGVEVGMTKLQAAERLLLSSEAEAAMAARGNITPDSATPAGYIRRRSAEREAAAHAALLDAACAFSPRVEETAADTALLDVAGLERLFGPPQKLARDLARRVSEFGLEANVAVASNPDAAMHAARGLAGVTVIPPGQEAERLSALPVDVLLQTTSLHSDQNNDARRARDQQAPVEKFDMLETLDRWGVRTLRALAALPEVAVAERLGQAGVRWQKLARGATSRPLVPAEPPLKFEESIELEYPVELLDPLAFLLSRMLEQICARLGSRAMSAIELRLRLELECSADTARSGGDHSAPIHQRTLRLPVPMLDAKVFLKLLQLDLRVHPPAAPVTKIFLGAEPVRPRYAQGGLFLPLTPEPERLELTLARIAGVVGKEHVGSPEPADTHRPDSFRMQRFAPPPPNDKKNDDQKNGGQKCAVQESADPPHGQAKMALRRLRPPLRATVELRAGVPAAVACSAFRAAVLWSAGPWRASGEWWNQQPWAREEWDIAVQLNGSLAVYRVYRDAADGGWYVEGAYD
jgi:protein ImuB